MNKDNMRVLQSCNSLFIYHHVCVMLSASRLAFYIVDLVACTVAALKGVHGNTNPNQRISHTSVSY